MPSGHANRDPLVSVVVPFFNLEDGVDDCIRSLLDQDGCTFAYEILAVDNMSDDGTAARLERYRPRIRLFHEPRRGAAAVRNAGIRGARGTYLALIDGDCVAGRKWLAALEARARTTTGNAIMGGPILPRDPRTLIARFSRRLFDQEVAMTSPTHPYAASGNLFLRRSFFLDQGMFDETFLRSHDVDFCWRAARQQDVRFAYVPEAHVYHRNPETLGELFREGIKHGRGMANISTRHSDITGYSVWQRIVQAERYRLIVSDIAGFVRGVFRFRERRPVRYMFHFYWAVFNSGKQLGCALQGARFLIGGWMRQSRHERKAT